MARTEINGMTGIGSASVGSSSADEALLHFLYQAPIGLVQAGADGEVLLMNPMAAQLLMRAAPEGDVSNLFAILGAIAPDILQAVCQASIRSGMVVDGQRVRLDAEHSATGASAVLALQASWLDASTLLMSVSDVTQQVRQEQDRIAQTVRHAVRADRLTGLPTREVLREHLDDALYRMRHAAARHGPVAVLSINIDRFHRFNLMHGPAEGDLLLQQLAERLAGAVRSDDGGQTLVARLGADEFAVVIGPLSEPAHATAVAQRIVAQLCHPYAQGAQPVHITVSVGLALADPKVANEPGVDPGDTLLQAASLAMREAKRHGGGRWRPFESALQALALARSTLEADLRLALERNELFTVYQPIVQIGGPGERSVVDGVEALVRWRHPERGLISPLEFIDLAEQSGLIVPLGEQVLGQACRQMAQWIETLGDRAPRIVSVNLSIAQLRSDIDIVQTVHQALDRSGLAPERLQLEITESLAAQDGNVRRWLLELKGLGVRLALDDFGTGYSSLSSLQTLPVDVLKIDRSFVSQLEASEHHRALVRATVLVARSLNLQTVAEGVEMAAQVEELRALGCDKAQGYWFAKPMGAGDATRWLAGSSEALKPRTVATGDVPEQATAA
jgi:diguanylate cyclase (GGDEF)-like protein